MELLDSKSDGTFGSCFGHPEGNAKSKLMVERLLAEFQQDFESLRQIILSVQVNPLEKLTKIKPQLDRAFYEAGWNREPYYPESNYRADYGLEVEKRWIFVEAELSDDRRTVNAFFMSRVFRTGYMRLGILLAPESTSPESKRFYSSFLRRYAYLSPDYPLWIVGFSYP
jgi:hypothetical protein